MADEVTGLERVEQVPDGVAVLRHAFDGATPEHLADHGSVEQQRVTRVRVADGVLAHQSEVRERKTYTFRNEDTAARTVIVEHPVRSGYQLRGDVRPFETTAGWMRFRVPVEPKQSAALVLRVTGANTALPFQDGTDR